MYEVRPKRKLVYTIMRITKDASCQITCEPQQKWCVIGFSKDIQKRVVLVRENTVIEIPQEDFEKNWMVI